MRVRRKITISLEPEMAKRVDDAVRVQHRTRSELMLEALRAYFSTREFPEETPTPAELRAIQHGESALKRGDYITLDDLRREEQMARRPRRARAKVP